MNGSDANRETEKIYKKAVVSIVMACLVCFFRVVDTAVLCFVLYKDEKKSFWSKEMV